MASLNAGAEDETATDDNKSRTLLPTYQADSGSLALRKRRLPHVSQMYRDPELAARMGVARLLRT